MLITARLSSLIQPLIEQLGYEFVGLEFRSNPKNPALTIYIDQQGGVDLDDCERVSREVAALLDVEDPVPGQYQLEISSPGLDRPLFTLDHFRRFTGETAALILRAPQGGRRRFTGKIVGVSDARVLMDIAGQEVSLEAANIAKAHLVPDYDRILAAK